jgi:hypothetical protein
MYLNTCYEFLIYCFVTAYNNLSVTYKHFKCNRYSTEVQFFFFHVRFDCWIICNKMFSLSAHNYVALNLFSNISSPSFGVQLTYDLKLNVLAGITTGLCYYVWFDRSFWLERSDFYGGMIYTYLQIQAFLNREPLGSLPCGKHKIS